MIFLGVHVHTCTHSAWKHACILGQYTNTHTSAKWSQNFIKLSAYVKIGLVSWLIMFLGMYVHVWMQSAWKHACNLGQYTNPHSSAKWSQISKALTNLKDKLFLNTFSIILEGGNRAHNFCSDKLWNLPPPYCFCLPYLDIYFMFSIKDIPALSTATAAYVVRAYRNLLCLDTQRNVNIIFRSFMTVKMWKVWWMIIEYINYLIFFLLQTNIVLPWKFGEEPTSFCRSMRIFISP